MKIKLQGTYPQSIYAWNDIVKTHVRVDEVTLPIKLSFEFDDKQLSFTFIDYQSITSVNYNDFLETHKGKLTEVTLSYDERIDQSGGKWRTVRFLGKYQRGYARSANDNSIERFSISQHQDGLTDIFAKFLRRAYPRGPIELGQESALLYLDQKSQQIFEALISKAQES